MSSDFAMAVALAARGTLGICFFSVCVEFACLEGRFVNLSSKAYQAFRIVYQECSGLHDTGDVVSTRFDASRSSAEQHSRLHKLSA